MKRLKIQAGGTTLCAALADTPTTAKIWDALPITGGANIWGDEIYFEIAVIADQEADARAEMEIGELGYWPVGNAFCIFFGPTPASSGDKPQAASPVNILGKIEGDATLLRSVSAGTAVTLSRDEAE